MNVNKLGFIPIWRLFPTSKEACDHKQGDRCLNKCGVLLGRQSSKSDKNRKLNSNQTSFYLLLRSKLWYWDRKRLTLTWFSLSIYIYIIQSRTISSIYKLVWNLQRTENIFFFVKLNSRFQEHRFSSNGYRCSKVDYKN